jgi:hypothetical protein
VVDPDRVDGRSKTFRAGAQSPDAINVFIDGASYKNDIQAGGVAGQQDSRGNPFPRNAVQEFRVATNNYKAEYQKSSSAIITAVTKSGSNTATRSAFVEYQNQSLVALDTFARASKVKSANFEKPDYRRTLVGLSAGGAVIPDKLFYFGSYEGNYQNRQGRTVFSGDVSRLPASVQAQNNDVNTAPFRSNLLFGKLSYNQSQKQLFELTGDLRKESEKRGFGGQFAGSNVAYSAGENFKNDVGTARLKHTYYGSGWTNEAFTAFQYYGYKPTAFDFGTPAFDYDGNRVGGKDSRQSLTQKKVTLRNDLTYTAFQGLGDHAIKVGFNADFARYDLQKQLQDNPTYFFNYSPANPYTFPVRATLGFGEPGVRGNDQQYGVYAQDDWSPTKRLTLNLGLRYDYETGMNNTDYVTPQAVRDSLRLLQPQFKIPVDLDRYTTDGTQRKNFKGAIQPRVGASYSLDENARTTVFGSFGMFYDRVAFNNTIDETYRRQHPVLTFQFAQTAGPGTLAWDPKYLTREGLAAAFASGSAGRSEVYLVPNDLKPPRSNQFSGGLRHDFGTFNASATYSGTRSFNGLSYEWANVGLQPNGNCCATVDTPAYQNILVGNNTVRTWYNSALVNLDRPYRRTTRIGWGAGLAYTFADAEGEGTDLFSFPTIQSNGNARHRLTTVDRHRVVLNGLTDVPYAFGIQASTVITLASGRPFARNTFTANGPILEPGNTEPEKYSFILPHAFAYRNVDVRLRKDFANVAGNRVGVTADLFNAFNYNNFGCFDDRYSSVENNVQTLNPTYGRASCVIADARRFQFGVQYDF